MRPALLFAFLLAACTSLDDINLAPTSELDLVVNQEFSLAGYMVDANQRQLEGRITWHSSNPSIATVDANGTVKGVHSGVDTVTAISDNSSGAKLVTIHPGGMVDTTAGAVHSDDGVLTTTYAAHVFTSRRPYFISRLPEPNTNYRIPGTAWSVATDAFLDGTVTITMKYDPSSLPAGTDLSHLQIIATQGYTIGSSVVDTVAHTVTLTTTSQSANLVLVALP